MTSMLPPTRDLPPGRHARIRAEVERAVNGRRTSRLTVPVLAAAAAVLTVAASVVLLRPDPNEHTPAVQITTSPPTTQTTPVTRPAPVIAGLSPERIAAIEKGCLESAGLQGDPKLHQHVGSGPGAFALIYTADAMLACSLDIAVYPFNSAFSSGFDPEWLPGHFAVDSNGASTGGDTPGNRPVYKGVPGYRIAAGRIDSKVARVTLTVDGQTVDATIANNTFVVRIVYPSTWSPPPGNDVGEVKAYDAAGNLLGSSKELHKCFVNPKGDIVSGSWRGVDPKTCESALPWR